MLHVWVIYMHAYIWDCQWKLDHTGHVKVCAGYHTVSSLSSLHWGIPFVRYPLFTCFVEMKMLTTIYWTECTEFIFIRNHGYTYISFFFFLHFQLHVYVWIFDQYKICQIHINLECFHLEQKWTVFRERVRTKKIIIGVQPSEKLQNFINYWVR